MKKRFFFLLSLLACLSQACEDPEVAPIVDPEVPPVENPNEGTPGTPLPAAFKGGVWFWGSTGPFSYVDVDGNEVGKEIESGRQYQFSEDKGQARYQFQQYLGMRTASNCVTEYYTHTQGTITFEGDNLLTLHPVMGKVKTVKGGKYASCAKETTEKVLTQNDLKSTTLRYEFRTVEGEKLLYVFKEEDTQLTDPLFVYDKVNQ